MPRERAATVGSAGPRRSRWRAWFLRERKPVLREARDPVAVIRGIIEPCDGIDRPTLELLADEEGLGRDLVDRTLARLRTDGTLRYERGPDGEEVFAWAHPA